MLSYDTARCVGTTYSICRDCQRRSQGREYWQSMIAPAVKFNLCDNKIDPEPIYQTGSTVVPAHTSATEVKK